MPESGYKLLDENYDYLKSGDPVLYEAPDRTLGEKLWDAVYYDKNNKPDIVAGPAVAVLDDILPGIPFVDIFPDPPEEDQFKGIRKLAMTAELAGAAPYAAKGVYKFAKDPVKYIDKAKNLFNLLRESGISTTKNIWDGYNDTYKWFKRNPHPEINVPRPFQALMETTIENIPDAKSGQVIGQFRQRTPPPTVTQIGPKQKRMTFSSDVEKDIAFNRSFMEDKLPVKSSEPGYLRQVAGHEFTHWGQADFSKTASDKWWKDLGSSIMDKEKFNKPGIYGMKADETNWRGKLYNMLSPKVRRWAEQGMNTIAHQKMKPQTVHLTDEQEYLVDGVLRYDPGSGVPWQNSPPFGMAPAGEGYKTIPHYFGKEIGARVQEIRNALNIKNRDVTAKEISDLIRNASPEDQDLVAGALKDLSFVMDTRPGNKSWTHFFAKINKFMPALIPPAAVGIGNNMYEQKTINKPMM
jgi:hypothetical protein